MSNSLEPHQSQLCVEPLHAATVAVTSNVYPCVEWLMPLFLLCFPSLFALIIFPFPPPQNSLNLERRNLTKFQWRHPISYCIPRLLKFCPFSNLYFFICTHLVGRHFTDDDCAKTNKWAFKNVVKNIWNRYVAFVEQ